MDAQKLKFSLGYSALNTARSALSAVVICDNSRESVGTHPDICTYLRGVFNEKPPIPRYNRIWNPKLVLDFLRSNGWFPARRLSLKKLTLKLTILLALVSGHRCETLCQLDLSDMIKTKNEYRFNLTGLIKQSRPGFKNPQPVFRTYPADKRICVYKYLHTYIDRTKEIRGENTKLLLTFQSPHHPPTGNSVSRWLKVMLKRSGVDTELFGAHSCRAASVSAAKRGGANIEEILVNVGWTQESTFAKFYNKPLVSSTTYQDHVMACK